MIDYVLLGSKLKTARLSRGLTQEKLAELTGISVSFYGHIERGRRIPSIETIMRIIIALDAPAGIILDGTIENKDTYLCIYDAIKDISSKLRLLEDTLNKLGNTLIPFLF